jgi:predicted nucleic acid-binding protein
MTRQLGDGAREVAEFFVVRRHRRGGLGRQAAQQLLYRHRAREYLPTIMPTSQPPGSGNLSSPRSPTARSTGSTGTRPRSAIREPGRAFASKPQDPADDGQLVISPIVYAEVSAGFGRIEDLDDAVPADDFQREVLPYEAGFLAGKAFLAYRMRGGQKRSPLPDFYIRAHSAVRGYRLLTRDATRYRTYFPIVTLIAPEPGDAQRA